MQAYSFDFGSVFRYWPVILHGVLLTLALTVLGAAAGLFVGILGAWGKTLGAAWLKTAIDWYIQAIRNTPFLIQLSFVYFGLPSLGIRLDGFWASLLAITIHAGAYNAEIIRSGLEATARGQYEAASSMGMKRRQIFRYVVLPPSLNRVWPALVSQAVLLLLDSAVCSQVSTKELTYAANLISSSSFRSFESYLVITCVYFLLAYALDAILLSPKTRALLGGGESK